MTDDSPVGGPLSRLPEGLDPIAELIALAAEASAILEAFSPAFLSTRERAAFERRRAAILATLAEQRSEFATAARQALVDYRAAEQDDLVDMMTRLRQGEPQRPGPELARSRSAEEPIPDAYARGRADWSAGTPSERLFVDSAAYREGLADERAAMVDAELLARAEASPGAPA